MMEYAVKLVVVACGALLGGLFVVWGLYHVVLLHMALSTF